jgi:hypothetical protein
MIATVWANAVLLLWYKTPALDLESLLDNVCSGHEYRMATCVLRPGGLVLMCDLQPTLNDSPQPHCSARMAISTEAFR